MPNDRSPFAGWWLGMVLLFAVGARSQSNPRDDAAQKPKSLRVGPLTVTGSWRVRVESWDWFEDGPATAAYTFPHSLFRLGIGQQGNKFDWEAEMAQATLLGLPTDAVAPPPQGQLGLGATYFVANGKKTNDASVFLKQAFVRIKGLRGSTVRFGRFESLDGSEVTPKDPTLAALEASRIEQRLLGNFGWAAVQRSFDGVHFVYAGKRNNFTLVAARPTQGVFQAQGMNELDVGFVYGSFTMPIQTKHGEGELRLFGLGYDDVRGSVLKTDNRPTAARQADRKDIRLVTFGADAIHVFHTAMSGNFDFLLWGAVQAGRWGVQVHRAGAFVAEFGWQPPLKRLAPWLSAGYSFGSGDSDPNDDRHATFFQVLPTPRPYARFPFYNMENNQDFYGALNLHPCSRLNFRGEGHALRLSNRQDLWYLGGGAFQPSTFGYVGRPSGGDRGLANVGDLSAEVQVTRNFRLSFYYAKAWGKSVIANIYPKDKNGQFGYVEFNYHF